MADDAPDGDAALSRALDEIRDMSLVEVLQAGHEDLLRLLVAKVRTGVASHQEMAILRNILRDNGMVMGFEPMKTIPGEPLPPPAALPLLEPPDYDE